VLSAVKDACGARGRSAILDHGCARPSNKIESGTKKRSSDEQRNRTRKRISDFAEPDAHYLLSVI
jgi:hypothetical protein